MKQKVFTLLTLLVLCVTGAWADPTYKNDFTDWTSDGNGNYYTYLTSTNYDGYISAGWMTYTSSSTGNATLTIDPATDATISGTQQSYGKIKGTSRYMDFYVKGITSIKFYFRNNSGSDTRTAYYKLNGGSGTTLVEMTSASCGAGAIALDAATNNHIQVYSGDNQEIFACAIKVTPGQVNPTITFNDGNYNVSGSALDLRNLFSSNSTGAVTFTVTEANGTGASIGVDGYSFTATSAGTATVKASQAATSGYSAKEVTATITVTDLTEPTFIVTGAAEYTTGDNLTLSTLITANNSDGALSYTIKSDGDTGASISEGVFTATAAGTAVVTIAVAATATYAAASADVTITVTKNPLGENTVTFTLTKGSANVSGESTSAYISTFSSEFTASNLTIGSDQQTGYSGSIKGANQETSYVDTKYVDLSFVIADGYAFAPSAVSFKVNPLSATGAMKYVLALMDANNTVLSEEVACAKNTDNAVTFSSGAFDNVALKGTVHIRAYFYAAASDKKVYIKSPITVTGDILETEAITTASGKTYATYVTTNALNFAAVSKEIKAYVAASAPSAGNITFTGKDEVPATTPILVKTASAGATVYVPVIPSAAAISTNNLVAGTGAAINYNDGGKYNYILTNGQFKPANNSVVAVGKAYLSLDAAAAANELTISFDDEDGGVTGIQNLTPALSKGEGAVFDLQGRRVAQPAKGLYIVNGKKVVLK